MGYRGSSVVTTGYSCRNRGGSVPGFTIDEGYGYEPALHSHRVHTVSSPRIRHEHIDLSNARQPDSKFYNDVNARLAALGPEPVLTSGYLASAYSSAAPVLTNISSHHAPIYHHRAHHSPEAVVKRRTWTTAAAPVPRRSDFDAEVAAYLSYTPQTHHYSHRSSSLRSRSSPPVSHSTFSHPPFHPHAPFHTPAPFHHPYGPFHTPILSQYHSQSRLSQAPPSYIAQFQHRPDTSAFDWTSPVEQSALVSIHSPHLSTTPSFEAHHHRPHFEESHHSNAVRSTFPGSPLHYDYNLPTVSANFSFEDHHDHQLHIDPPVARILPQRHEGRSRTKFGRDSRSVVDTFCPSPSATVERAVSVEPTRLANFKAVKPPMSETRRKVRDLICKTRKDPSYYK